MKKLVLMVGIPGCGKTTLSQRLIEQGYASLNADQIRLELWGDEGDQREPEVVFGKFFARLEGLMGQGADIVVDNTNINTRHRSPILERARAFGYDDVQLWLFEVPLQTCLERNRTRPRAVPEDIVSNMHATVTGPGRPRRHEGKLIIVRPGDKDFAFRFFRTK